VGGGGGGGGSLLSHRAVPHAPTAHSLRACRGYIITVIIVFFIILYNNKLYNIYNIIILYIILYNI